jgi:4-amino-4-deoxy-L-arabinose transferase-like glycosyltransferase
MTQAVSLATPFRRFARRAASTLQRSLNRGCVVDGLIAVLLASGYVTLLLATASSIGYARDEGFYFTAARSYGAWFELLAQDATRALEPGTVDQYFGVNHEHPALMKSLFALSYRLFYEQLGWIRHPGTAYRLPGMLMGGMAVALTYVWAARVIGRWPGLVAALSLAFMPRVFFHAHLACFDVPVAAMWLVTTFAYWWAVERGGIGRALVVGVLYGLLLNTKHNAWLLPPALVLHWVIVRGGAFWRALKARRLLVPWPLVAMATVSPALLYATWPWLWHDTLERLQGWYAFHRHHVYYNMEFLGQTYWKPPMPRLYPWLMTAATVPLVTLLLFCIGGARAARNLAEHGLLRRIWRRAAHRSGTQCTATHSAELLWAMSILVSYAPWLSSGTPIFGGTKHWLTAYPFLALFAAAGYEAVASRLRLAFDSSKRLALGSKAVPVLLAACVLGGGAGGPATLGLNRTFWGTTTGSLREIINGRAAPQAAVFIHDTAYPSWTMMQRDGSLRGDLRPTLAIEDSDVALYHHEPHMEGVEYQIWVDYRTTVPDSVGSYDGVPVVWLYRRPEVTTEDYLRGGLPRSPTTGSSASADPRR